MVQVHNQCFLFKKKKYVQIYSVLTDIGYYLMAIISAIFWLCHSIYV